MKRALFGLIVLGTEAGIVVDIHGILDPVKLALINRWM